MSNQSESLKKPLSLWARRLFYLAIGLITLVVSAYIDFDVPGTSIPISGQSLAVFLVAWFLGWPLGPICVLIYLVIGFCGAPVFAGGESGIGKLTGGSGGFLVAFLLCACLIASLRSRLLITNCWLKPLTIFAIATILLLVVGNARLIQMFGLEKGLEYGFWPFWPGAILKLGLATAVAAIAERFIHFPSSTTQAKD